MKLLSLMARQLPFVFLSGVALTASSVDRIDIVQQWGVAQAQPGGSGGGSSGGQPAAVDGSTTITCGISTMLFFGATPPNGFMVQPFRIDIFVNDNGPASGPQPPNQSPSGFFVSGTSVPPSNIFITPPGYKPMGPVSVLCDTTGGTGYVAARAW